MEQRTISSTPASVAPLCGIYRITNSVTGDSYIGSSTNIHERWRAHQRHLKAGTHHNVRLHKAWLTYGSQAFDVTVLELCAAALLVETEQRYLDAERPTYNVALTAGQGPGMAGKKHSAATRAKLRAVVYTEERRAKIRATRPGIWTPEMRAKHRLSHLGKRPSPEAVEKGRRARMGHPVSEETRRKIGAANKAKAHDPHSPQTIAKMTAFQRARRAREKAEGKPRSEAEQRQLSQLHAAKRGRKAT